MKKKRRCNHLTPKCQGLWPEERHREKGPPLMAFPTATGEKVR